MPPVTWRSFVAMGDSFTEGLEDPYPTGTGYRGWADLVAARLAAESDGGFRYANLAVRGRIFDGVVDGQLPTALAMRPDLVSFAAGGNDALRRHFDGPVMMARFEETVARLRAGGADVLLFRFADVSRRLPAKRLIAPRTAFVNESLGGIAGRHGARLVDLHADEVIATNGLMWSDDRLHLSSAGHRRVAGQVLRVLGIEPDPEWLAVPAVPPPLPWPSARAADVRWAARYLAPWLKRRLTGRSSGDLVAAKRPELGPMELPGG
jgi:lysophospholipase L1-like esterase